MVKSILNNNVQTVFGYPGAAICPFYDALIDSEVSHILVRHEQSAIHAANGYARISQNVGVCIATSGPGATNLITGIASAYMDSIPVVAFTGQVQSALIGRDVFQEADITGACEPFSKHSYLVKNVNDLPRILAEAFYLAKSGRPGPVLVDVPVDIQKAEITSSLNPLVDIKGYKPTTAGNKRQIERACEAISQAKMPVIIAGGGIFISNAREEFVKFVDTVKVPTVNTMMGIGALPHGHNLKLGMLGSHGVKSANLAINKADLLIICGARVGDRAIACPDQVCEHAKVIHIDIDPAEIGKNMCCEIPIVGDLKSILQDLTEKVAPAKIDEWINECKSHIPPDKTSNGAENFLKPKEFIQLLTSKAANNFNLVADVGQNQIWSANCAKIGQNARFLTSGGMGAMGYSVAAGMGAYFADKNRQTIVICGDGSFQMQLMELATIKCHNLPIKIIVMNNTKLGMVREIQDNMYQKRQSGVDLSGNPDFTALAKSYGIKSLKIDGNSDVNAAIDEFLSADEAFLLECIVDPTESSL